MCFVSTHALLTSLIMTLDEPRCAPYGTWQSPITAELLASNTISIQQTEVDEIMGTL
jgi:hypothetical protein